MSPLAIFLWLLGLVWLVIATWLSVGTFRELLDADRLPARQAIRQQHMDRLHADTHEDLLQSGLGFLMVFAVIFLAWPVFLWQTLRAEEVKCQRLKKDQQ